VLCTTTARLVYGRVLMLRGLEFVTAARALGVGSDCNALPPIVTQIGLDLGFLLGAIVVIEAVFSWPGIGQLAARGMRSGPRLLPMRSVFLRARLAA
jgi:peptide/nickel transport system permease protein